MIIGLSGYARSGKDTVANHLVDKYGFTKVSFAQPMRDALYALNPIVGVQQKLGGTATISLRAVIDEYGGWDEYKETPWGNEIRGLMQRFGTEVGREQFSPTFWVDRAMAVAAKHRNVVFSDVRFPNEMSTLKNVGGLVWRVSREGIDPANRHASETALDDAVFDVNLSNNGDMQTLHKSIDEIMGWD